MRIVHRRKPDCCPTNSEALRTERQGYTLLEHRHEHDCLRSLPAAAKGCGAICRPVGSASRWTLPEAQQPVKVINWGN